jgi:beta propeller repeat protein
LLIPAGLLISPAAAYFSFDPHTEIFEVGDTVTLTGMNTYNSTTYLFVTGPYLDERGVMLTNTSQLAGGGYFDSVNVSPTYSWSFEWNTSGPGINLNNGIYVVYAVPAPLGRSSLAGRTYEMQNIYFQGRRYPVTTPATPTPTPVPTWAPPPAGVEVQVSSGPSNDYPGRFDGDLIVYEADRGEGNSDIYLYNITSGKTTPVATGTAIERSPGVYGETVVYSAYEVQKFNRSDADIFIYDVNSGVTTRLTLPGDQLNPRIYGDLLAWQDEPPGRSSVNVILYDLETQVKLKVPARTWAYTPDLSGGKVVWIDDPVAPAVYLYDISGKTVRRVTNKTGIKGAPSLDGSRITWADTRNDYAEIYVLDLDTGEETRVTSDYTNHFTPVLSGARVVWVDFRNGNRDIYLYDLAARQELAVTTSEGQQVNPQIAGCTVTWADNRNGSYDVYYKKIPGCTPATEPAPVSLQPEITSTPIPETTTPIPAATTSLPPSTPMSTPVTAPPTTKSPGFEAAAALLALAALVILRPRKQSP